MKITNTNWRSALTAAIASGFLVACGGGGGGDSGGGGGGGGGGGSSGGGSTTPTSPTTPPQPSPPVVAVPPVTAPGTAPAATGDIAADAAAWFNYRRGQVGVPALAVNAMISQAARAHSNYLANNSTLEPSQDEVATLSGFTGVKLQDRFAAAGYGLNTNNVAYGEAMLPRTLKTSGRDIAEEMVTGIYRRFLIFEPMYKEFGLGASNATASGIYFTTDFVSNNTLQRVLDVAQLVVWPYSGQTEVAQNFASNTEIPNPVPGSSEVGFPISVHANVNSVVEPLAFTVRPRGGTKDLDVKPLMHQLPNGSIDPYTPKSAAAIVPLAPLTAGTTYDVMFVGNLDGTPVARSWSFTTK